MPKSGCYGAPGPSTSEDPIRGLPSIPSGAASFPSASYDLSKVAFFSLPAGPRANCTILACRHLARGDLLPLLRRAPGPGDPERWKGAGERSRKLSLRIFNAHSTIVPPKDRPHGAIVLESFGGVARPPGDQPGPCRPGNEPTELKRGDLCRAVVDLVALPPAGSAPVDICDLSPRAAGYLMDAERRMLHADGQDRVRESDVVPFTDPGFRSRRARTKLAGRMWMAGLLRPVNTIRGHVSPFTVVKKIESDGRCIQRLVLDQRAENLRWRDPPSYPMASPGLFPFVEVPTDAGSRVECMVGDLPDMYWTLRLPEKFAEFFVLADVDLKDLCHHLRDFGVHVDFAGAVGVGMQVPLMGWSWAVFIAQITLEDMLASGIESLRADSRLQYGIPLPQFGDPRHVLHWEYIDDVGAMILSTSAGVGHPSARALGAEVRDHLNRCGLGFHKDEYGDCVTTLGYELNPSSFGVRPARPKFWLAAGALEEVLRAGRCRPSQLEGLLGLLCWIQLAARPTFAIWRTIYSFIAQNRSVVDPLDIPVSVLEELQSFLFIMPLLEVSMSLDWSTEVFMTDSCFEGAGIVRTTSSLSEIREEARLAETRGWTMALEREPGIPNTIESLVDALSYLIEESPSQGLRFLHLFSGPSRDGDLSHAVRCAADARDVLCEVFDIDILGRLDLMDNRVFEGLLGLAGAGYFHIIHSGVPCSTWSRARWRRPGPPPLRTRAFPFGGDPDLGTPSARDAQKLEVHSELLRRSVMIVMRASEHTNGVIHALENPEDPGPPYASVFACPTTDPIRKLPNSSDFVLDQCRFGLQYRKPTQILSNCQLLRRITRRCNHGYRAHPTMIGQDESGGFVTFAQSRYPPKLCEELAAAYVEAAVNANPSVIGSRSRSFSSWSRERTPSIGRTWDPVARWHLVTQTRWKYREHNNIGELRAIVLLLRHLSRSSGSWRRRVLIISDSMVSIGVLSKGRSPAWPLLRLARQAAVIQLLCEIRPYFRYVESKRNHADGPSRGFPVGPAPDWALDAERDALLDTIRSKTRVAQVAGADP